MEGLLGTQGTWQVSGTLMRSGRTRPGRGPWDTRGPGLTGEGAGGVWLSRQVPLVPFLGVRPGANASTSLSRSLHIGRKAPRDVKRVRSLKQ